MLRLPDPSLVVLVGASGSGKSTWAAEHFRAEQIVSSDALRAVVGEDEADLSASADAFAVLEHIVELRLRRRLTTVVDTLGLDPDRRRAWVALAERHSVHPVAVAFDTPGAEVRRRNRSRARPVPAAVLTGQLSRFRSTRPLLDDESFAAVIDPVPVRVVPPAFAEAAAPGAPPPPPEGERSSSINLRFGLQLSTWDIPGGPAAWGERITDVAARAEAAGFGSLWVMDHFRQIPQLGRPWADMPESTAVLGYLAAATRTATIGCLVNCVTYRNPAHLAKIVATLDVLSGGRACCGLGAGWYEAEHLAYGYPFPPAAERLDRLEDVLRLLPLMWGQGTPSYEGATLQVPEAMCYPRPLGKVPILVGGSGEHRTLRLVAQYADACNLTGRPDQVRRKLAVLRRHCAELGRDPAEIEVTHLSTALVARDEAELDRLVEQRRPARNVARWAAWNNPGTVDDHVLRIKALQAAGVDHVIVSLPGVWNSKAIERMGSVITGLGSLLAP